MCPWNPNTKSTGWPGEWTPAPPADRPGRCALRLSQLSHRGRPCTYMHIVCFVCCFIYYFNCILFAIRLSGLLLNWLIDWRRRSTEKLTIWPVLTPKAINRPTECTWLLRGYPHTPVQNFITIRLRKKRITTVQAAFMFFLFSCDSLYSWGHRTDLYTKFTKRRASAQECTFY